MKSPSRPAPDDVTDRQTTASSTATKRSPSRYQISWSNPIDGSSVVIAIRHTKNYLVDGTDHIEIESRKPKGAALPITATGYLSHFIDWHQLSAAGGPVTFVEAWLARVCRSREFSAREHARRQGDLFAWADARDAATKRKRSGRPKAKRTPKPAIKTPPSGIA